MKTARGYKNYFSLSAITATVSESRVKKTTSRIHHSTRHLLKGHDLNRDPPDEKTVSV